MFKVKIKVRNNEYETLANIASDNIPRQNDVLEIEDKAYRVINITRSYFDLDQGCSVYDTERITVYVE